MLNPIDPTWWQAGSQLNWWDCTLGSKPGWLPDTKQAHHRIKQRLHLVLQALALIHEYRTIETSQLHELNPKLPRQAKASLYRDMAALQLIDVGYPISVNARTAASPYRAPWMAVRLPIHARIESQLEQLEVNPVQMIALGPGPLRGARQYDRHNLICVDLAIQARQQGWLTYGELYGRFSLITSDPLMGSGGPDLILKGEHTIISIELTASANMGLEAKIKRWQQQLSHPACKTMHVCWLDASNNHLLTKLEALTVNQPHMHVTTVTAWKQTMTCTDNFQPQPGTPQPPRHWMRTNLNNIAQAFGFPNSNTWHIPASLNGI